MNRLVFVTQQIDPAHPTLGAATAKVRALSARLDEVVVLAARAVPDALPDNARFESFAASTQVERGLRFESALVSELARGRPCAVLAHMSPIFAVLAAPLARPLGVPVLLWFTHWKASRLLRLAERASSVVLSVDATTFPIPSPKLVAAGHGIDVDSFDCTAPPGGPVLRLVSLGRYSRAKGLSAVIRAVGRARAEGVEVRLDVHGPEAVQDDAVHREELERLVAELRLDDAVSLGGALPREDVPAALAGADALVNNMRPGAADKVVFEACAACRPAFAAAHAFAALLPDSLRFPSDDDDVLAQRLVEFARLREAERRDLGIGLRERVRAEHSADHWADRVLEAAS